MKAFTLCLILGIVFCGCLLEAQECQNLTYSPQYASQCIDGYMWMMRVEKIENCVVYTIPVSPMYDMKYDPRLRTKVIVLMPCGEK
jgi:hypothetical protein